MLRWHRHAALIVCYSAALIVCYRFGCNFGAIASAVSDPTSLKPNAAAVEFNAAEGQTYPIVVAPRQAGIEGNFVIAVRVPGAPTLSPVTPTGMPVVPPVTSAPTAGPSDGGLAAHRDIF